jgi:ATP-dependent DNA helicase RecQ
MTKEDVLRQYFGYRQFRPLQAEVIEAVLAGRDALVIMPTGGGKSVCYQVPAMLLPGLTVVVSPLIALMQDQVRGMDAAGIPAAFVNSSIPFSAQQQVLEACMEGKVRLLYVSPEKLLSQGFLSFLEAARVRLFAVDESHCISFWGHDFRPEYAQLSILKERFPAVPILALTATADRLTRSDILRQLSIPQAECFLASFDRPNLSLKVLPGQNRLRSILDFLRFRPSSPGIIYCLGRKSTEGLAEKLAREGISARHYHAGMDAAYRRQTQEAFLRDEIQVLAATVAFGMGIDKPNIRWIIHYNLPGNVESFYQEIGRAGRDGLPSETLLFYSFGDVIQRQEMIASSALAPEMKDIQMAKLDRMRQYAEAAICRRRVLLSYFNEQPERDCGNCDVCQHPPRRFDGTELAQKALSAIARTQERVGITMLIDILRGSRNQQLIKQGYDQIKTFGAGRDLRPEAWTDYLLQMLNSGCVDIAYDQGHALRLNAASWEVLRGQRQVPMVQHDPLTRKGAAEPQERQPSAARSLERQLAERIRERRRILAQDRGLPAFTIFNDATLEDMAARKPLVLKDMEEVSGMGQERVARYGELFIQEIRAFLAERQAAGELRNGQVKHYSQLLSLLAFQAGKSVEEIAAERSLSPDTICGHLLWARLKGEPVIVRWPYGPAERQRILGEARKLGMSPDAPLKPLFEALGGEIPYFRLRLALLASDS